jgi:hypothetical protein
MFHYADHVLDAPPTRPEVSHEAEDTIEQSMETGHFRRAALCGGIPPAAINADLLAGDPAQNQIHLSDKAPHHRSREDAPDVGAHNLGLAVIEFVGFAGDRPDVEGVRDADRQASRGAGPASRPAAKVDCPNFLHRFLAVP